MHEEQFDANKWTFIHTDIDGVTTTSSFTAETWPYALQQFVNFLKGAGHNIQPESIAINTNLHPIVGDDYDDQYSSGWYGAVYTPEGE